MDFSTFFVEFARLRSIFEDSRQCPMGANLIHYLSQQRSSSGSFDWKLAYEEMNDRTPEGEMGNLGYAPQDSTIFKARYKLMSSNNTAYRIATKSHPTAEELEKFASTKPQWSILWPVKLYLQHHLEVAREYRGFLPFGSEVISFIKNAMKCDISPTPTAQEHIYLRDLSNGMAAALNIPSIVINDMMYILGSK